MENKNEEQLVYLKDLWFAILYQWKQILAVALVLSTVCGCIKGVSSWKNDAEAQAYDALLMEQYNKAKAGAQDTVDALQKKLDVQKVYLDNALLMKLNPYSYYEATLTIYIDTDYQILPDSEHQAPDKTASVINSYQALIKSQVTKAAAEVMATEPRYLSELLSVSSDFQANTLTLTVDCIDQAGSKQLLDLLSAQLLELQAQVSQSITDHTISVISRDICNKSDSSILSAQIAQQDLLDEIEASLALAEGDLTAVSVPVPYSNALVKSIIVFSIIGGIAGIFVMVLWILIRQLSSTKVFSAKALRNRTGVKILGCARSNKKAKGIDAWLRRMDNRSITSMSHQAAMLAVSLRSCYADTKQLLITGSSDPKERVAFAKALAETLPSIHILEQGSILNDPSALETLGTCDAVLLLEQCELSHYPEVNQAINVIYDYHKPLIGCVLLDG